MSKTFRRYEPDQMLLMPVALQEWLPADHLAYFISDVVDQVDLKEILSRYEGEERGYPPYHPVMMVKVLVYAYCVGAPSSRRIEKRLHEDIAFRVLAANNTPDFRTISDFRKEHLVALGGLFLMRMLQMNRLKHSGIAATVLRISSYSTDQSTKRNGLHYQPTGWMSIARMTKAGRITVTVICLAMFPERSRSSPTFFDPPSATPRTYCSPSELCAIVYFTRRRWTPWAHLLIPEFLNAVEATTREPQAGVAYLPAELTIRAKSEFNSAHISHMAEYPSE